MADGQAYKRFMCERDHVRREHDRFEPEPQLGVYGEGRTSDKCAARKPHLCAGHFERMGS